MASTFGVAFNKKTGAVADRYSRFSGWSRRHNKCRGPPFSQKGAGNCSKNLTGQSSERNVALHRDRVKADKRVGAGQRSAGGGEREMRGMTFDHCRIDHKTARRGDHRAAIQVPGRPTGPGLVTSEGVYDQLTPGGRRFASNGRECVRAGDRIADRIHVFGKRIDQNWGRRSRRAAKFVGRRHAISARYNSGCPEKPGRSHAPTSRLALLQ